MKIVGICFILATFIWAPDLQGQQITIRKATITDSISVADSIPESFALYLPSSFEPSSAWPLLLVFDMKGRGSQVLAMFREASEEKGYVLAASNSVNDSLSISDNILITNRMIRTVMDLLPIQKQRIYTAGFATGAQMAALVPSFIREVAGVISIGADLPNTEILNGKTPFYYLGLVGKGDFTYPNMDKTQELLNRKDYPNNLLVFEGDREWPDQQLLKLSLDLLSIHAMSTGQVARDSSLLMNTYRNMMGQVGTLGREKELFAAYNLLEEVQNVFSGQLAVDSLDSQLKTMKRGTLYRTQRRDEANIQLREALIREDFIYYLEEDILTYNFNNLGWWNYQMDDLDKYRKSTKLSERYMGSRLEGYLNALIEDNIDMLAHEKIPDEEALLFLWMLKTITAPSDHSYYLKIISVSSKYEDYGTALFYLEELLKNGYQDKNTLYELPNTALLRITPEFNAIIEKYLKDARYEIIQEE